MRASKNILRALFVLVALACGIVVAGCDDVIDDPTFRTWCGDQLCSWKLESGSIRRAATWHPKDYGVELVDTPTAISQETSNSPRCLELTTIANVAPEAQVTVGLDFNRDGTIDHQLPLAATGFREAKLQVTAPLKYEGIRFVITKKGAGTAILAQMRVRGVAGCTAPPVEMENLPLGTPCSLQGGGDECVSGVCCDGICSECCQESPVGEQLPNDGGILRNTPVACPDEGKCERASNDLRGFFLPSAPLQCDPGKGKKGAKAECVVGADCASGVCEGAVLRSSSSSQGVSCPADFDGGPSCNVSMVRGGTCR
ncbi:MAG: hypothetical protein KF819_37610 [Labilithrix sp.]|nr:hypothetical protein [Labilithrix sp.]